MRAGDHSRLNLYLTRLAWFKFVSLWKPSDFDGERSMTSRIYEYGLILDDITYSKRHYHTGEYTINPIIAVNPSVVAYFDMTITFECIPDHKFKLKDY